MNLFYLLNDCMLIILINYLFVMGRLMLAYYVCLFNLCLYC